MRGRILTAPYEDRDSCVLNAMLVDGTLYLEEHSPDAKLAEKYIYLPPDDRAQNSRHVSDVGTQRRYVLVYFQWLTRAASHNWSCIPKITGTSRRVDGIRF